MHRQNPEWRSRLKKDPGIPNLFPYKDKILHEIEEKKRVKEEEAIRKREDARASTKGTAAADAVNEVLEETESSDEDDLIDYEAMDEDEPDDEANPMAALLASAKARAAEYEEMEDEDEDDEDDDADGGAALPQIQDTSRKSFTQVFKNVLSSADVLLYVLDARDPIGTRSQEIEHQITAADAGSKRLILILNKIDLVPPKVLKAWLVYLRRYFPTLPLRASNPAPNARTFDHKALTVKATSETLLRALKSYAASKQLKRAITVGVIGYPNVGKSSVINALTSRLSGSSRSQGTACPVGAEAGVTTTMREVKLDNKLKILDCPGIVFPSSANSTSHKVSKKAFAVEESARLTLLSALPPKSISDPIPAVTLLVSRLSVSSPQLNALQTLYQLPPLMPSTSANDYVTDLLVQIARKRGRLGKGGVPNIRSAAMAVLMDWRDGRIMGGWIEPPVLDAPTTAASGVGRGMENKQIVTEWAEEFKLEGLWGDDGENDDPDGIANEVEMAE